MLFLIKEKIRKDKNYQMTTDKKYGFDLIEKLLKMSNKN